MILKSQQNRIELVTRPEMDKVMALRREINTSYEKEGIKVSVNDFIIKATALACRQASWTH